MYRYTRDIVISRIVVSGFHCILALRSAIEEVFEGTRYLRLNTKRNNVFVL